MDAPGRRGYPFFIIELRQHARKRSFFVIGGTIFAALLFPQKKPKEITHKVTVTKPDYQRRRADSASLQCEVSALTVAAAKANRP